MIFLRSSGPTVHRSRFKHLHSSPRSSNASTISGVSTLSAMTGSRGYRVKWW